MQEREALSGRGSHKQHKVWKDVILREDGKLRIVQYRTRVGMLGDGRAEKLHMSCISVQCRYSVTSLSYHFEHIVSAAVQSCPGTLYQVHEEKLMVGWLCYRV